MVFVIDVGNTNLVMGIYKYNKLISHWRMETVRGKSSDEFGMFILNILNYEKIDVNDIRSVVIGSVVPHIMYSLEHAIRKYFKISPLIVGPDIKTGIKILVETPRELGADRLVNAVAGYEIYKCPLIIVDFGTATTFCAITGKGEYLGGAICPGLKIAAEVLFEKTAKLPRIEIVKPKNVIGKNTIDNMQSGLIYGYIGQVDFLVTRMKDEMNEKNIKVIATGGLARLIASESKYIDEVNPLLTLEGLRIIYEKNKEEKCP